MTNQRVREILVEALEKQIPKKVRIELHQKYGYVAICPNCSRMDVGLWNYCPSCGQALLHIHGEDEK